MKRTLKKSMSILLAFTLLFGSLAFGFSDVNFADFAVKANAEDAPTSGTCGENLTWTLDTETGELVISGTGDMTNYSYYNSIAPWYSNRSILKAVTISNGVTSIGDYAFDDCDSLTSITIPNSVTSIGENVFSNCSSLTSIMVDPTNLAYSSDEYGALFNKNKTVLFRYPIGNTRTSYFIPDSVININDYAFAGCNNSLTSITIPDSVTNIGDYAFSLCNGLTSITIPNSVTSIGENVFSNCSSLTSIMVDPTNLAYSSDEYGALFNKNKTVLFRYPIGNTRTSYFIPDSVININDYAFAGCNNSLTSITIPDSVTNIGDYAFSLCNGLTSITIPDSVTSIGDYAFAYNYFTSITIPNSVTSIGDCAFHFCVSLVSIEIPDSVTSIGHTAFAFCYSLTSVTIPDSVTSIGVYAFAYSDSLTDVYYTGTEDEWNAITIGSDNGPLLRATIHYNYVSEAPKIEPTTKPDDTEPSTTETTEPSNAIPEVSSTTVPAVTKPIEVPTTTKPIVTEPPTTKPIESQTTKPVATEPATEPNVTEPTTKPTVESTTKPEVTELLTTKPVETTKPESTTKPAETTNSVIEEEIIKKPSTTEVKYGETLILHADFENIPADAKIEWSVDGEGVTIKPSADGKTCAVTSTSTGDVTVTAKYVDSNGVEHVSEQEIESNASFWQKIVSFFKNLFGMNRIIEQKIKF